MEAIMEQMKLKNINKSNWKKYHFDEIARNISERVDPNKTDLTTYIGLEHIDSENIHITRSGTPDDVNGTKLRFYKGDVIFGRRRAYQRKAGIAECDGFCSAHALVLRANPDVIHPKLFPFFLHSDSFMDRAVKISVGSLSPTINWGTLKFEEFLLPPPEEQENLAKLLWAMDEVIERENVLLEKNEMLLFSFTKLIFTSSSNEFKKLGEVSKLIMGQSPPGNTYNEKGEGFPFLQGNAEFGPESPKNVKFTTAPNKIAPKNSILISVRAPVGDLNIADQDYCIGRGLAAVVINDEYFRKYIFSFLNYSKNILEKKSTGSTFKAINKDILSSLDISIPNNEVLQQNIIKITAINEAKKCAKTKIDSSKALQKSLINQIF